jgi:hypothetical protein
MIDDAVPDQARTLFTTFYGNDGAGGRRIYFRFRR